MLSGQKCLLEAGSRKHISGPKAPHCSKPTQSFHLCLFYLKQLKVFFAACDKQSRWQLAQTQQAQQKSPYRLSAVCFLHCLYPSRIFIEHSQWDIQSPIMVTWQVSQEAQSGKEQFCVKTHKYFHLSLVLECPWNWALQTSWGYSAI